MNVSLKKIDAVSTILKVEIEKSDYTELWNKNLRTMRQKAVMPGFRKGMVPFGLVKKMYGKQLLLEEINKLVSENISAYLRDNEIDFLGEPIPNVTEQKPIDYDTDEDFEYCFDIALSPEFDIKLSKDDKLIANRAKIDDEIVERQVDTYRKKYGSHENAEQVEAEDIVKGTMVELVDDEADERENVQTDEAPKPGGLVIEDAVLLPSYLKVETEQMKFINAKVGDTIIFNPYNACQGAEAEIASLLRIDKEAVKEMKSDFSFEIKEISRFVQAALDQELFDKVLGKDEVQNETDFRDRVKSKLSVQYSTLADYKLRNGLLEMLIQKAGELTFADDILKRWMLLKNEKMTKESIENDYPNIRKDLISQLAKRKIIETYDIQATKEEIEMMARQVVKMQFAQYGLYSVPDETLEQYAGEMMKKQESVNNLVERVLEEKVIGLVKDMITIEENEISSEEFINRQEG